MHLYIKTLKQRVDAINQLRIDRALSTMNPAFKQVYILLPILLHCHFPSMPGYFNDNVPQGICMFEPNKIQLKYLKKLKLNYETIFKKESINYELPIIAIYSMGSTSSIGQNYLSDLDIWVCHQSWLDEEEKRLLQHKCSLLEDWAISLNVKVNFFLIDENRFRHNESGILSYENCGSTQNILLLDEFYRTAVRLAGKCILWNLIPYKEEEYYDDYVMTLYIRGILKSNEWIDFGGLNALSAEEYFSASLWQLYKSKDSPYKSILKAILLEAYSWEYPNSVLLAQDIKQHLHNGEIISFGLDPYCMMLERITKYLKSINDYIRLDLVRRCFYLKVCEQLSYKNKYLSWRREVMTQLVTEWGWDNEKLTILDNRANWKIDQVLEIHNELIDAMMKSYNNLIHFSNINNINISTSLQDINLLKLKLYSTFDNLPNKINLINKKISNNLSESYLTFMYLPKRKFNNSFGWYLYNSKLDIDSFFNFKPIKHYSYLTKLITWSIFNGILTSRTNLFIKGNNFVNLYKLKKIISDILQYFSLYKNLLTKKDFFHSCEIRHLAVIVNLEYDPTTIFLDQIIQLDLRKLNIFSFGKKKHCLVGSIDHMYINSWNEIHTFHFNGDEAIIETLMMILSKIHQNTTLPESIKVFCYSKYLRKTICTRIHKLISECIALRLSNDHQKKNRFKIIKIAGNQWGLFFEHMNISIYKLKNSMKFYNDLIYKKRSALSRN